MHEEISERYQTYTAGRKKRRFWRKIVNVLGCVVIFCTTYALILPAITMEQTAFCGLEEHIHSETCYAPSTQSVLICKAEQLSIHVHNGSCYGADNKLICGQADYVAHSHDSLCYDGQGNLVCDLPLRSVHTHGDECFAPVETPEPVLHVHSEACNSLQRGELICQQEEYEGHGHGGACYAVGTEVICAIPENHLHGNDCYTVSLECNLSTESHSHSGSCYTSGALNCELTEDHDHDDNCYEQLLACGMEAGQPMHDHGTECYGAPELTCGTPENHIHTDTCFKSELVCTTQETPGHSHEDACYQWDTVLSCGMEEGEEEPVEPVDPVLICTEPVAAVHVHGDSCLETMESQPVPVCGKSDQDHTHTADCYTLSCGLEEHRHDLPCYSDPEADVENAAIWEATFAHITLTGDWNADVLAIAESQLGYAESTRNYKVWDENTIRGYTRYGHWYGSAYGDWCAMFVSFCLNYAEVEGMPLHWGVRPWIEKLTELELYFEAENYDPQPGDLVFFDWEDDGLSDHVGIVAEVIEATETEPAKLKSIEGNSSNRVQYVYYDLSDPVLLGYSKLPEKEEEEEAETVYHCGIEAHLHEDACYAEDGTLTCLQVEHAHTEECIQEAAQYFCGLEEHTHSENCYAEDGNLLCQLTEHTHAEECTQEATQYFCGLEEHNHSDSCYAEDGNLLCQLTEHTHSEECTQEATQYFCGLEEHTHSENCYAEDGMLTCLLEEHVHTEECMEYMQLCICGLVEHIHENECYNENGVLICEIQEHTCAGFFDLGGRSTAQQQADSQNVQLVINMISSLPTNPNLNDTQLAQAFVYYNELGTGLQESVTNRQSLLDKKDRLGNDDQYNTAITNARNSAQRYVHFDGTNGNITTLAGAGKDKETYLNNWTIVLPDSIARPPRHDYVLDGWYWINGANTSGATRTPDECYYDTGDVFTVTANAVFYSDWKPASYNFGQNNGDVVPTVSTNDFITTHLFDYNSLFNMYTSTYTGSVSETSHNEVWTALNDGDYLPVGQTAEATGIILRNWDTNGNGNSLASSLLSIPSNYNSNSYPHFNYQQTITPGLMSYTPNPKTLLFDPQGNKLGVTYVGTADYLFQYNPTTGYYSYNSAENAAAYNQSQSRFYVYNYKERTTNDGHSSVEYDFLPFNSPYGTSSELKVRYNKGENIYYYDHLDSMNSGSYNDDDDNDGKVYTGTNFWFGMSTEIRFYLPNDSGADDSNLSIHGDQMIFEFSGDDDVWVYVDDTLVLDIGGIHKARKGTINFSTGAVFLETNETGGYQNPTKTFSAGEHKLTMYYTERGSSLSNCSIKFNISPRFELELKKVDASKAALQGSKFEVFTKSSCTDADKATLWPSYELYKSDRNKQDPKDYEYATNVLDVSSGVGRIWGLSPGNTYYIKETVSPNAPGYILPNGLIQMVLDNRGNASYSAGVIKDPDSNKVNLPDNPTDGFIVTEFKVDELAHSISMTVQNTYPSTELYVKKLWEGVDVTPFSVTVNLLADGVAVEGKSVELSEKNNWQYTWENLPKLKNIQETVDGVTQYKSQEIQYTVQELGELNGFTSTMSSVAKDAEVTSNSWTQVNSFRNNKVYLLKTDRGLLAADATRGLYWTNTPDEAAQWTAATGTDGLTLKNGKDLYLRPGEGNFFIASSGQGSVTFVGSNFTLQSGSDTYYMTGIIRIDGVATVGTSSTLTFSLREKTVTTSTAPANGYVITNTAVPGVDLTSLTVAKKWVGRDDKPASQSFYENLQVVIRLLANDVETGDTLTLKASTGWTGTFNALPVRNDAGTIRYSVKEVPISDWTSTVAYNTTTGIWEVTNKYSRMLEIPMKKQWHANTIPTEITVQLYSVPNNSQEKVATKMAEIPVTAADNWEGKFVVIPPEELGVTYYVYEPTYSFAAEYDTPDTIYIQENVAEGETPTTKPIKVGKVTFGEQGAVNTVTITNYAMESLPNTGGPGTTHFMTGGLLTTAAALIMMYINKKRTIRKDPRSS